MKHLFLTATTATLLSLAMISCSGNHLISDSSERELVYSDLKKRKASMPNPELFNVFSIDMTQQEYEAMAFLYAYMPLGDITDHSPDFHFKNVQYALRARSEMPWGKSVPEREFRHFVLPVRVNNENTDSSRWVFYNELKDRVRNMTMYDAVLEVNHWCHEKVIYTPSDPRTSSPLASVKTAYGRCGEESTFTVAALRSVGIPARQVYTPRWAHTDNNHAWVEAWVDGKWMFLGACEPEPVLNLGWFNSPASRSMLMHTKVFGRYTGPEEVMERTPLYTEINVIDTYAPSARIDITVTDTENNPVPDAKVEFRLYNYAEFYTIATKQSDANGQTFLSAGKGDLVVWASKDGKYGFRKVSFGKDNNVTVSLDKNPADIYSLELNITPPAESSDIPDVTETQRAANNRRLAEEDSIRNAYVATFMSAGQAAAFAGQHGYGNFEQLPSLIVASRGNHTTITTFLAEQTDNDHRAAAFDLLTRISPKDLRDVTIDVLRDNLQITPAEYDPETYGKYIRNPRVGYELLTPYKGFFHKVISPEIAEIYRQDPTQLVRWVSDNITIDNNCNLRGAPISPSGVWNARIADATSRNIFFVALARSFYIPAYIDPVTGKVQIIVDGKISDVQFETINQTAAPQGKLIAGYTPSRLLDDPKYYNHFTISRITPDGTLNLLYYDEGESGMEEGTSWSTLLRNGTQLDCGNYLMVTGTRLANGGVLTTVQTFEIKENETTVIDLIVRESLDEVQVIGTFDSESKYLPTDKTDLTSVLSTSGRGYYIVAILGVDQEPTNHALRDIAALSAQFNEWGRSMIFLFPDKEQYAKFRPADFPALPSTITYGIDIDNSIKEQIIHSMKLNPRGSLPIFIIADTFNRIVFCSQGYTIGLGEQLLNTIRGL